MHAALPAVNDVHDNMASLLAILANMPELDDLHSNLTELGTLHTSLPELTAIHAELTALSDLHTNLPALVDVHTNMNDILNGEKAASLVQVAEDLPSELPAGNLQAILIGLSNRIKTLEGAAP